MRFPAQPPTDYAVLFAVERRRLLELVRSLEPSDWLRSTPCPGWDVRSLATHILGGDFSVLSWQRDDHQATRAPEGLHEPAFIAWIDQLQIEWVDAAQRMSPQLTVELLDWTGERVSELVAAQDPSVMDAHVSWASNMAVPRWLDQARELTERWVHRQQLLEAVDAPSDLRSDLAGPVLDAFSWAYPYRLSAYRRPRGSAVDINVSAPDFELHWHVTTDGNDWALGSRSETDAVTRLDMTAEQAWRLLTNNYSPNIHGVIDRTGDEAIVKALIATRAIIGTPK